MKHPSPAERSFRGSARTVVQRRVHALALFGALLIVPMWASGMRSAPLSGTPLRAGHGDRSTWDSVFSVVQAKRGEEAYGALCARCHKATLGGGDESPPLTGSAFMSSWNGQTLHDLHERIRTTMPTDTPAVYSRQQVTDVIAYLLQFNGFPAGAVDLTHENDALKGVRFVESK